MHSQLVMQLMVEITSLGRLVVVDTRLPCWDIVTEGPILCKGLYHAIEWLMTSLHITICQHKRSVKRQRKTDTLFVRQPRT